MKQRITAFILFVCLMLSAFATTASAIVEQKPVYTEGGTVEGKEDAFPAIESALKEYQVGETITHANDEYIGIPVYITVYNDPESLPTYTAVDEAEFLYQTNEPKPYQMAADSKPVIFYVINTNTERVGTDSDVDIIRNFLKEGYIVLVTDYKNEKRAKSPDLDWSLQKVRTHVKTFCGNLPVWINNTYSYHYIVPAGYTLRRGIRYFNFAQNGVDGILEVIVEIWNIDLKRTSGDYNRGNTWSVPWGQKELLDGTLVYQDKDGNRCIKQGSGYAYYTQNADYSYTVGEAVADTASVTPLYKKTSDDVVWENATTRQCKIRYAIAEDWWDMVKPNGERLDMNLYLDITYPTNPDHDVPVMMLAASAQTRTSSEQTWNRPLQTGFMFTGYAFVNYDYAHTPMAREDHFGYFEGESSIGRRNGFMLDDKTGVQSQTSAVRCVRAIGELYDDICLDVEAIGVWGHSKSAAVNRLGTAHPELEKNDSYIGSYAGACSNPQLFLTYSDGTPIPSNVQLVYASNGEGSYNIYPDAPPTIVTQGEVDGSFTTSSHYAVVLHALRANNVPALDMSMEGVGHTTIYGYNEERDYDMYQAFFDFCNYYLKDEASVCEYILPKTGTVNVPITDDIIVKFTGPIPESEIREKVKVRNAKTGELVGGVWTSAFAGNEWTFEPFHLEGGTTYIVEVGADIIGENNKVIKSGKSVAFRTVYETQFDAVEVASSNGSFTLTRTESGANGVFFLFDALNVEHNVETTLRFAVTNEAATLLRVYGISTIADDITKSTVNTEPIGTVGVAGNEIVEIDVTDYVKSIGEGKQIAFYVETVKVEGTTNTLEYDLNSSAASPNIITYSSPSGWCNPTPNGTRGFKALVGHFVHWSLPVLDESDYGRLVTVSFEVYSTMERSFHINVLPADTAITDENGEFYMDYYNDSYKNIILKANQWQTVSVTYFIDDKDYVAQDVQKRVVYLEFAGRNLSGEFIYIDNITVTDTVIDATVGTTNTSNSIVPTLAVKTAEELAITNNQAGYVVSGEYADTTFDGADGYLVSGAVEGVTAEKLAATYIKTDLRTVEDGMPYVLGISILNGAGALDIYGIADIAEINKINIDTLNYLNAPAFDRSLGKPDSSVLHGGEKLGTLNIFGAGDYQFTVTDYIQSMKGSGKNYAAFIIMAADGTVGEISFSFIPSKKTSFNTVVNGLDFDRQETVTLELGRGSTLYDVSDLTMQGDTGTQKTYENNGVSLSSTIRRGSSGQSLRIQATDNGYNVYKFLKLIETPSFLITEADLGNSFTITFSIYLEKASSKTPTMGLASVGYNASGDGSDAKKMHQGVSMGSLAAGQWHDITYTFTVTEMMLGGRVGASGTSMEGDRRPVNFAIFGIRNTTFYIDNMVLTATETYNPDAFKSTLRTSITMESKSGMSANGFESIDNGDGTTSPRMEYSTLDNTTYGGSYAYRVRANKSYNRIYATNLFRLTSENIGDTFTVTFKMKSNKASYLEVVVGDYELKDDMTYEGMPPKATISITADEVGQWVTKSYTFTVTEGLVNIGYSGIRLALKGFGSANSELFFDDFVCMREIGFGGKLLPVGESKDNELLADNYLVASQNFEGSVSYTPGGWEQMTNEAGQKVNRYGVVDTQNTTEGGTKALFLQHNKDYNRLFLSNMFTNYKVGDVFTVQFKVKSSRAGKFYVDPAEGASENKTYTGMPTTGTVTINADQVGQWISYTYTFTVTEGMMNAPVKVNGVVTNAPASSLRIYFLAGFGRQETTLYLDDFIVYRNLPSNAVYEIEQDTKTVTNDTLYKTENASATPSVPGGIHKFFFSYDLADYLFAHKTTLSISAKEEQGQLFKLWALNDSALPEELTYNSIAANAIGEDILQKYAYGGAPLATFAFDENGEATIDVTAFVKRHLGEGVAFAIIAERGSMKYLNLDMAKAQLNIGTDISATGTLTLDGGKLNAGAGSVTIHNAFASGATTITKGTPVTVTASVSGSDTFTVSIDGTPYQGSVVSKNGTISYTFTPEADLTVSSITISSTKDFALTAVEISANAVAVLNAPSLMMYLPTAPECDFTGVVAFHNVSISESLIYNLYIDEEKGAKSVSVRGESFAVDTLPTAVVGDKIYRLLTVDTVAKDAFGFTTVTVTLRDGKTATYDIGIRNYLEQLLKMAKTDEEYSLAADMLSYLAASVIYFYETDKNTVAAANAVRDSLLGEGYDGANPASTLPTDTPASVSPESGMLGAGMYLAERPTFYFIAQADYENATPVFVVGGHTVEYKKETVDGNTYFILSVSPIELTEAVTWTIGDKSGSFNLRAYYDWAKDVKNDTSLTHLTERLYRYAESVQNYFK